APAGSDVRDNATYVEPPCTNVLLGTKPAPDANHRPVDGSYRTRGSVNSSPGLIPKRSARATLARGDPAFENTVPRPFTRSSTSFGPAATCVSGGATA